MFKFPSEAPLGEIFKSREEYLNSKILSDGKRAKLASPEICNAIASANSGFTRRNGKESDYLARFPWLTMVIGSGCVTESVDASELKPLNPSQFISLLSEKYGSSDLSDGISQAELARDFAQALIKDRFGNESAVPYQSVGATPSEETDAKETAELVLAAALSTCLYNELAAAAQRPFDFRGADRAFLSGPAQRVQEIGTCYKEPLKIVLESLTEKLQQSAPSVYYVLKRIEGDVSPTAGSISRLDVQILTEFAWLSLTRGSAVYYGWSDLLSHLARLEGGDAPIPPFDYPPRPRYAVQSLVDAIKTQYLQVTKSSWKERLSEGKPSRRRAFFDSAAKTLIGQARLRRESSDWKGPDLPIASAFTTSFDIELTMSLVSCSNPKASLQRPQGVAASDGAVIIFPVNFKYLVDPENISSKVMEFRWIAAIITDPTDLVEMIDYEESSKGDNNKIKWVMVNKDFLNIGNSWTNWPIVVHLAGAPLLRLPSKIMELDKHLQSAEIGHTLLLDEYWALQHNSTEMIRPTGDLQTDYGLPNELTDPGTSAAQARFWMMMGVQMNDTAIRHRLAARLTSPLTDSRLMSNRPRRSGLVVTPNLDVTARNLLFWMGADIVCEHCFRFIPDLEHYLLHLDIDIIKKLLENKQLMSIKAPLECDNQCKLGKS